jgi:hypothetical protein
LLAVAIELENSELSTALTFPFDPDMPVSSFCERFRDFASFPSIPEEFLSFIASHFASFEWTFLGSLPIPILTSVLSHDCLRLESEDSLYAFWEFISEANDQLPLLLECIQFQFLSCETQMERFVQWSSNHFNEIDFSFNVWMAICARPLWLFHPSLRILGLGHRSWISYRRTILPA